MKYYNTIINVELPISLFKKAKTFATTVFETINYSDSNQFSKTKIINDHYISKLGEEAVKIVFSDYADVTGPDYKIYQRKDKSWSADLQINNLGLAVKTQKRTAANRYGLSWTFQCGQYRRDKILNSPESWVCFVEFDDVNYKNFYVYPPFQIKELKFCEPFLEKLKGHKVVVYASDLSIEDNDDVFFHQESLNFDLWLKNKFDEL